MLNYDFKAVLHPSTAGTQHSKSYEPTKQKNTSCDIDDTATCWEIPRLLGKNGFVKPQDLS